MYMVDDRRWPEECGRGSWS